MHFKAASVEISNAAPIAAGTEEKAVSIRASKRGIISGASHENVIRLKPYDADLVE